MRNTTLNKYSDTYKIFREPKSMKPFNQVSWNKIKELINSYSTHQATFEELCHEIKGHLHNGKTPGNEHLFIIYCIKNNWLSKI